MNITFIGAGNLATHLAMECQLQGHKVVQVYSRTAASAELLGAKLNCLHTNSLQQLLPLSDLYIFAVADNALPEILATLSHQTDFDLQKRRLVHTAGSVPVSVFEPYALDYGVLYPLQTFSKQRAVDFARIPIFVEASTPAMLGVLLLLANKLSANVSEVDSESRKYLHLAAVFACNFTNYMYGISEQILAEQNLDFNLLVPLISETANKIKNNKPTTVQTGPAVRYDTAVIGKHIDMLAATPDLQHIYETLSKGIHSKSKNI